jgi:hypothetical protein
MTCRNRSHCTVRPEHWLVVHTLAGRDVSAFPGARLALDAGSVLKNQVLAFDGPPNEPALHVGLFAETTSDNYEVQTEAGSKALE